MLLSLLGLVGGCATSGQVIDSSDPIESTNRVFFDVNETLDKHFMKPVAEVYADITPLPIRTSVTNFFENLTYLNVVLNSLLQGKFDQGIQDTLRFVYNSTFGIAGYLMSLPAGECLSMMKISDKLWPSGVSIRVPI